MAATRRDVDSGQACADALVESRARILEAEADQLALVAHWADLHGDASDPAAVVARLSPRVLPGTERLRQAGGHGTPEVGEFAAAELGVLLATSTAAAANLIADAVDLRHRMPRLWDAVMSGSVPVWKAREAAKRTRSAGLSLGQARRVDVATTPYVVSLPWGRFLGLLDARIIEADPAAAEERRQAAASQRFVETGQCDELGLRTVIARAAAGDATWFVAMCDRVAQILEIEGDTDPVGARRSKALGILAHPARAFALLARHAAQPPLDEHPTPGDDSPRCGECGRSAPADVVGDATAFVRAAAADLSSLLPPAVLYVHLSHEAYAAALGGRAQGVARMEGVGPVTVEQVREFLGHAHVTVTPVLDLAADRPVDGYEVPDRMREQLLLRSPATAFPFTPSLSRSADADHTVPYLATERGGPPGQTRIANLGRLLRHHHRVKTHGHGWVHRQPSPGVHYWRTPQGHWARVDATGSHLMGRNLPAALHGSPMERAFEAALTAA